MSVISRVQNEARSLQLLAAQRQLYSNAKRVLGAQWLLYALLPIVSALVSHHDIFAKAVFAYLTLVFAVFDFVWLEPVQVRLRSTAARVQEAFDCYVLRLPWNALKAGSKEIPEVVAKYASPLESNPEQVDRLRDWYSPEYSKLPIEIGRVLCQRTNCWWDFEQRRKYSLALGLGTLGIAFGTIGLGVVSRVTAAELFLTHVAPLVPLLSLGGKQWREHAEAAERVRALMRAADDLVTNAFQEQDSDKVMTLSRSLQDEILDHRKRSPLVFDWVYNVLADEHQQLVDRATEQLIHAYAAQARGKDAVES